MARSELIEAGVLATRLGFTAFGGPAAHIAMLHDEVVTRRGWLSEQEFLDMLGATSLIPGPNSTEMVIHVGARRAGWRGLLLAGIGFILPAALIVTLLAWAYVNYGGTPSGEALLYGVKPVVIAIVLQALWKLGQTAVKGPWLALLGAAVALLYFVGVNELALLAAAALVSVGLALVRRRDSLMMLWWPMLGPLVMPQSGEEHGLWRIFWLFLKVGSVLYGSGYVLLAFLRNDLVVRLGWLTDQQLLDAISIGQVTPGPVFTTATFVGYLLAGVPGAVAATVGIFLPAFIFVAILHRWLPRLRENALLGQLLDGVNAAALGLMAAVTLQLGRAAIVDPLTLLLAAASAFALWRWRLNSVWLIALGAIVGLLMQSS